MQAKGILLTDGSEKDKKVKNQEKEKSHNIKCLNTGIVMSF